MPSMRLDRTSGGRARRHRQALPALFRRSPYRRTPRVPTDLPHTPGHPRRPSNLLQASPGTPHTLQLRLPMVFLGPQDTEPSSLSPRPLSQTHTPAPLPEPGSQKPGAPPAPIPQRPCSPGAHASGETPRQAVMSQRVGA